MPVYCSWPQWLKRHRTVTPIRVSHELALQFFYSVEGEMTSGQPIEGPGELRMMQVKFKVLIPSVSPSLRHVPSQT